MQRVRSAASAADETAHDELRGLDPNDACTASELQKTADSEQYRPECIYLSARQLTVVTVNEHSSPNTPSAAPVPADRPAGGDKETNIAADRTDRRTNKE